MAGGLSTLNFMQGAMEGYKFMEDRRDKQQARLAQAEENAFRREDREADRAIRKGTLEVQQAQVAASKGKNEAEIKRIGLENDKLVQEKKLKQQELEEQAIMNWAAWSEAHMQNKEYAVSPAEKAQAAMYGSLLPDVAMSGKGDEAEKTLQNLFNGGLDLNSPEVSDVTLFLFPEIQGAAKHDKKIIGARWIPVPADPNDPKKEPRMTLGLKIEGQEELPPLTVGRTDHPDDPVRTVTVDDLLKRANNFIRTRHIASTDYGKKMLISYRDGLSGKKGASKNPARWEHGFIHGMPVMIDRANGNAVQQLDERKSPGLQARMEKLRETITKGMAASDFHYQNLAATAASGDEKERAAALKQMQQMVDDQTNLVIRENPELSGGEGMPVPDQVAPPVGATSASEVGSSSGAPQPQAQPAPTQALGADYKGDGTAPIQKLNPAQMSAFLAEKQRQPNLTDREIIKQLKQRANNGR